MTWFERQDDGIYLFRVGKVFTLQDLVLWGAERGFSTYELYYYYNCLKVVKKRQHPEGRQELKDAAQLRFRETGHYGHYNWAAAGAGIFASSLRRKFCQQLAPESVTPCQTNNSH